MTLSFEHPRGRYCGDQMCCWGPPGNRPPSLMTHVYRWGARMRGIDPSHDANWNARKGMPCRVLARGAMNSALIEFEDGFQAVVSRNALGRK